MDLQLIGLQLNGGSVEDLKKVRKPTGELKFFTRSDQDGEKVYDRFGRLKGFTDGKDTFDKSGRRVCLGF